MAYRKFTGFVGLGMAVMMLGGCSFSHQNAPGAGLSGLTMEGLCRQDYTILDTVEGSGKVTRVLGFDTGDNQFGYIGAGGPGSAGEPGLAGFFRAFAAALTGPPRDAGSAAVYDAMSKVPQADTFLPMTRVVSTSGLPGIFGNIYSVQQARVRGKAVKIKPGSGKNCPVRTFKFN